MDEAAAGKRSGAGSSGNVLLFAAGGIAIYVLLRVLDPAIAYPLRYISSGVATLLLNALSLPATREGTTISTADFAFDVNPDCSGSTSLRIMLTLGALWFGMYPNLTMGRRLLCLLLAAPIAVLCNALRVTALVFIGDTRRVPVEGLPHEMIGLLAFALAMAIVYLMTLLMAKEPSVRERSGPRAHLAMLVMALLVCYAPVLWGIPLLASTPIVGVVHIVFVVAGVGLFATATWGRPAGREAASWIPVSLFTAAVALLVAGTMTDVITFSAVSLGVALFALALYLRGWGFAVLAAPLLGVIFLGLPSVLHGWIARVTSRLAAGDAGYHLAVVVEALLAAAFIGVFLWLTRGRAARGAAAAEDPPASTVAKLSAVPMKAMIFTGVLGVLFQTWFNSGAARFDQLRALQIPAVLGEWTGVDRQPTPREVEVYGRASILSRVYQRPGFDPVHLLVSSTGAKRSNTHHPMRCMMALGWDVRDEEVMEHAGPAGAMPMTKLRLARDDHELEMRFWFDGGDGRSYLSYRDVYLADVTRRLFGRRTDWRVFRLYSRPGSAAMDAFLDALSEAETAATP
ncbi:MAG: archaeosortase/exosortase family protein [Akkermansiaceae bacterium]|nr:archaeosortase/exosortase family protein [Akkermansiaceae bacterium]